MLLLLRKAIVVLWCDVFKLVIELATSDPQSMCKVNVGKLHRYCIKNRHTTQTSYIHILYIHIVQYWFELQTTADLNMSCSCAMSPVIQCSQAKKQTAWNPAWTWNTLIFHQAISLAKRLFAQPRLLFLTVYLMQAKFQLFVFFIIGLWNKHGFVFLMTSTH